MKIIRTAQELKKIRAENEGKTSLRTASPYWRMRVSGTSAEVHSHIDSPA